MPEDSQKNWSRHPLAIIVIVLVLIGGFLWFLGGELFCRVRGGVWIEGSEICINPND